jgi:ribosomal protein S18 acetylase RimI-like enzyme
LIRKARIEDAPTIVGMIRNGSDEDVFYSRRDSVEEQIEGFKRYAFDNRPKGYEVLVHQTENTIEGYVDYQVKRGVGHILGIYVERDYRRKGVGKRLMKKALEDFKRLECHKARLEVFAHNAGAISLYEHLGFKQEGFLHKDEEKKDVIILSRFPP